LIGGVGDISTPGGKGMVNQSRKEYIEWYETWYGVKPKEYLLEKYYPIQADYHEATQEDWDEFWETV
jgi:hypothetical protein